MPATITTDRRTYVLDIDPYDGHVTVSYEANVDHFASVFTAQVHLLELVAADVAATLSTAPWIEV